MKNMAYLLVFLGVVACGDDEDDDTDMDATMDASADATETSVVSGTVEAAGDEGGGFVEGATVTVLSTDAVATTDAQGFYSVQAPVGTVQLLVAKDEHWSRIVTINNPANGTTDVDTEIVPNALVAEVAGALGDDIDAAKGVIFLDFDTEYQGGGESANVTTAEGSFTFDTMGDPAEGTNLLAGGDSFLMFYGVPVGTTTVTVQGASGVNACVIDRADVASWPVQAATFTEVKVTCTPL